MAIAVAMDGEILEGLSFTMRYTQTVGEVFFIIVTIVAYMYLVYFVRSKSREIANQRRGGIKIDKKLLMTIAYTYICLVIFTFPYFAERVAHFILQTKSINEHEFEILGQNFGIFKFIYKCNDNCL